MLVEGEGEEWLVMVVRIVGDVIQVSKFINMVAMMCNVGISLDACYSNNLTRDAVLELVLLLRQGNSDDPPHLICRCQDNKFPQMGTTASPHRHDQRSFCLARYGVPALAAGEEEETRISREEKDSKRA